MEGIACFPILTAPVYKVGLGIDAQLVSHRRYTYLISVLNSILLMPISGVSFNHTMILYICIGATFLIYLLITILLIGIVQDLRKGRKNKYSISNR